MSLPASFVERLSRLLRSCDQPLIQLWSWPWSGKRRLLETLAENDPGAWVRLPTHGALVDRLSPPGPKWLVAEGRYRSSELLAAAEMLRPEQRLVLPVERRLTGEILPQRLLGPPAMLLRPAEIDEMFAGAPGERIDELARLSDGWFEPLAWLRDRLQGGGSTEIVLGSTSFAKRFHQRVTSRPDLGISEALIECSVAEELDVTLWRRVWIARPERLAALERLLCEWGWVISEPGVPPRLPRLVRRAALERRPPPERRHEIFRQLGLGAYGLGLVAEAEHYLSRSGDVERVGRLRAVGAPAAAPERDGGVSSATQCPSGLPRRGTNVASSRFDLQLLGQAMVRRIDASGQEHELEWRLRRAFQSVAFLALAGDRRATKEQLVDAVWRDAKASAIAKNFHPTMSEARRTVHREVFVYSQGLYTLNPELDWWIDCDCFREQIEHGRRLSAAGELEPALDAWLAAWRLYRGELLSGVEAAWIRDHRQAFHHDYIELLRGVGGLCARLDRVTQALDAYRSLLLQEPFEEHVHLAVMELYSRRGRRDLVRRQFVRMQELLTQELNVEPAEDTQERYHQLMR